MKWPLVAAGLALAALHLWCMIDAVRKGRGWLWVIALLIVPVVSVVAYLASRSLRARRYERLKVRAEEAELREARAALAAADNRANQLRLAGEYARLRRYEDAIPHYRAAVGDRIDAHVGYRLANALYRTGRLDEALGTLEASPPLPIQENPEYVALLRAEILTALGRKEAAAAVYAALPGWPVLEAFADYAGVLIDLGRPDEALVPLERMEAAYARSKRQPKGAEAERYNWAMAKLAELRASR